MRNDWVKKAATGFLIFLMFAIPIVWWTRLNANYYSTKLTLLFFTGGFAWLMIPRKLYVPKFPRLMLLSLVTIVGFQIIYHTYAFKLDEFLFLFKFLSFAALVLWIYALNSDLEKIFSKVTYAVFAAAVAILAFALYEFYKTRIIGFSADVSRTLGTFGNVNMFAEFFVLSLPFIFHWSRFKDKVPHLLKLAILTVWIFFILYCKSRSAWIGLLLWLLLFFRYKATARELLFIGLAFFLYMANVYAPSEINDSVAVKGNSFNERLGLYEATLDMIKDNPWGIKVGRFMGEIELYQMNSGIKPSEFTYFDQPHSEFLKWGAQFGWLFIVAVGAFLLVTVIQLFKWARANKNLFFVQAFMVLAPQMLFQFPFENPASLLYLSVVVGLYFHEFASAKEIKISLAYRPLLVGLFLAGTYSALGFLNSVYQESTTPKTEGIVAACEYYPINIKACHAKYGYYLEMKQFSRFTVDFKEDFMKEPFFVDYLRLLPTYYSLQQNNKKTCEALYLYKTIFPEQVAFEVKYYDNCKGFSNLFYFEDPKKFRAKYFTWLDNLN